MTNTSATGGYLVPTGDGPLEGEALEDFFNDLISGITGLNSDTAVIPAWQEEPPNLPPVGTDWAAFRISDRQGNPYAYVKHNPGVDDPQGFQGSDTIQRQELLSLECSFYGPGADDKASLFRDGLSVAQNREKLQLASFGLLSLGQMQAVPSLVKQKWLYRIVVTANFRRTIQRTYPVLDLKSAGGTVNSQAVTDTFLANKT